MSDNIFYNIFSDNGSFMLGLSLGAIICVALIVIGVVRFTAAKGTNGGFSAMLFMACGVLALIITPAVTMVLSNLLLGQL
jgi:hypothetical protein